MRIGRAQIDGRERVVVQTAGGLRAVDAEVEMLDVIRTWPARRKELVSVDTPVLEPEAVSWLAPLIPDKLICIGINYGDHVAEMEAAGSAPAPNPWPFSFLKPPKTTLIGHDQEVPKPSYARKLDWEAELAVVIGDGRLAAGDDPLQAVFGFSVLNDLSVRDHIPNPHTLGLDAVVAKGFDRSAPMGPLIVTPDEVGDPRSLFVRSRVNGVIKQDSNTSRMIFGVAEILKHLSRIFTLSPGDVIATGTPAGVGAGRHPQEMLEPGDVVEAEVEGVGRLRTEIVAGPGGELLAG
jgi:2-keto-4-pentenoate hydratase/2-oxohepta-3-ene-1,7-dioic acid hydratase in catechol pathway